MLLSCHSDAQTSISYTYTRDAMQMLNVTELSVTSCTSNCWEWHIYIWPPPDFGQAMKCIIYCYECIITTAGPQVPLGIPVTTMYYMAASAACMCLAARHFWGTLHSSVWLSQILCTYIGSCCSSSPQVGIVVLLCRCFGCHQSRLLKALSLL